MSYHISSCKTVILYFIIYCIFISFYSSVKNFIVLVRLMNYFFIQYVISTINLWVFFFYIFKLSSRSSYNRIPLSF